MSDKVITPATGITLLRIGMAIWAILNISVNPWSAFFVYGIAATTDVMDGWVARSIDRKWPDSGCGTSNFGKFIDPIADKILMAVILFINLNMATIILFIELVFVGFVQYLILSKKMRIVVTELSRKISIVQGILIVLLLFPVITPEISLMIFQILIVLSLLRLVSYICYYSYDYRQKSTGSFFVHILTMEPKNSQPPLY